MDVDVEGWSQFDMEDWMVCGDFNRGGDWMVPGDFKRGGDWMLGGDWMVPGDCR